LETKWKHDGEPRREMAKNKVWAKHGMNIRKVTEEIEGGLQAVFNVARGWNRWGYKHVVNCPSSLSASCRNDLLVCENIPASKRYSRRRVPSC